MSESDLIRLIWIVVAAFCVAIVVARVLAPLALKGFGQALDRQHDHLVDLAHRSKPEIAVEAHQRAAEVCVEIAQCMPGVKDARPSALTMMETVLIGSGVMFDARLAGVYVDYHLYATKQDPVKVPMEVVS